MLIMLISQTANYTKSASVLAYTMIPLVIHVGYYFARFDPCNIFLGQRERNMLNIQKKSEKSIQIFECNH